MSDLPDPDPIAADRRRARRCAKLPPDPACEFCGIDDVDLLEVHHVLGRDAAPDAVIVLCKNHHAKQTALQHDQDALPPLGRGSQPDSLLERLARALRSLAVFLHELAHTLAGYADRLLAFVEQLDVDVPGWRDWGTAQ